jgi:hypothetical protein
VSDDGCGLFQRIDSSFRHRRPDAGDAGAGKGKLTSQPDRHTGRGLFFTSRLADVFDLHANATAFQYRGWDRRSWHKGKPMPRQGTSIYLAIALDTTRTLDDVLRAHSLDGDGYGFDRTVVPLQLMQGDGTWLESRAQAGAWRRGCTGFRRAEVDFTGIADMGHGFADELFRVAAANPGLERRAVGMAPRGMMVAAREAAAAWSTSASASGACSSPNGQSTRQTLSMLVPPG